MWTKQCKFIRIDDCKSYLSLHFIVPDLLRTFNIGVHHSVNYNLLLTDVGVGNELQKNMLSVSFLFWVFHSLFNH